MDAGHAWLEVAFGGAVAAAVSMLVFPERAHKLGIQAASRLLRDMAGLLPAVLSAFTQSADLNGIRRRQTDLGRAVGAFDELAAEATRPLSTAEVERLFALGLALDQLFQNAGDLARRIEEYSTGRAA